MFGLTLDFGNGPEDFSGQIRPHTVRRHRAVHNELKPEISTCRVEIDAGKQPEIPDNPAGTIYRPDAAWTGWGGNTGVALARENGQLKAENASNNNGASISIPMRPEYQGKTLYVKFRSLKKIQDVRYYPGSLNVSPSIELIRSDGYSALGKVTIETDYSYLVLYVNANCDLGQTAWFEALYIGDGSYLPPNDRVTRLANRLMTTTGDVRAVVTKGGAPFFKGTVRPTHKLKVGTMRAEGVQLEVVDALYRLEKKCRANKAFRMIQLCKPQDKANSLLHQIFYLAGFADSELDLPEILEVVESAVLDADKDRSYRDIVETILRDVARSMYADASGVIHLYDLAPTSLPTVATLTLGPSGNVAEGIDIERVEAKMEAVDVTYYPRVLLPESTIFEDTTGASGGLSCKINLAAGEYYPKGASATDSVRADYKLSDYEILDVASPSLVISASGVQVLDQSPLASCKGMMLKLYAPYSGPITKLQIRGAPLVKGDKCKVIKEFVTNSEKREAIEAEWIGTKPAAERVAIARATWYDKAAYRYGFPTTALEIQPGDYVSFDDRHITGIFQTLRVVAVDDGTNDKAQKIQCEGVGPYTYESLPQKTTSGAPAPSAGYLAAQRNQFDAMAEDGLVTPQEKNVYAQKWAEINGDGAATGSYWATRKAALAAGVPTSELDLAREVLAGQLLESPGVLRPEKRGENTVIEPFVFLGAFAEYFRAEAATLHTAASFLSLGAKPVIRFGRYQPGVPPEERPEFRFGRYRLITEAYEVIRFGRVAGAPSDVARLGRYTPTPPDSSRYRCGRYTPPSNALVRPDHVVDCGRLR